ncbi:MAG: D-tyrosyl-tRNA(Tyr) deacylase [Gammaproteobacteria bacterium]|nr:D-tyrosyl-tRNA(Tyr) deacylase [Gammaproteobacteria bacterium]
MLATVQRVSKAEVIVEDNTYSSIKNGLLIFICVEENDTQQTSIDMVNKIINFKMLEGSKGIASKTLKDSEEEAMIVSQFTLAAITNKGSKPSFHKAAHPEDAKLLYDEFVAEFKRAFPRVEEGKFGSLMEIVLVNKGPVTFNFKI